MLAKVGGIASKVAVRLESPVRVMVVVSELEFATLDPFQSKKRKSLSGVATIVTVSPYEYVPPPETEPPDCAVKVRIG